MSKSTKQLTLLAVIILIVFVVCSLLVPIPKNAVFWTAVGFMILPVLMTFYVINRAFGDEQNAKSRFYGFPIARVGVLYLIAQLIVSVIFIIGSNWVSVWPLVVISLILFVCAVVGVMTTTSVWNEIIRQDNKLQTDVSCMSTMRSIIDSLASQIDDPRITAVLKKLADEFKYSDPVSSASLNSVEKELESLVDKLQLAVASNRTEEIFRLCNEASCVLSERNRLCKLNKGL